MVGKKSWQNRSTRKKWISSGSRYVEGFNNGCETLKEYEEPDEEEEENNIFGIKFYYLSFLYLNIIRNNF